MFCVYEEEMVNKAEYYDVITDGLKTYSETGAVLLFSIRMKYLYMMGIYTL